MNQRTYDIALAVGVCLIAGGAWVKFGPADAALIVGGLVIGLTVLGAVLTGKS